MVQTVGRQTNWHWPWARPHRFDSNKTIRDLRIPGTVESTTLPGFCVSVQRRSGALLSGERQGAHTVIVAQTKTGRRVGKIRLGARGKRQDGEAVGALRHVVVDRSD